jgi:hypothetical protein
MRDYPISFLLEKKSYVNKEDYKMRDYPISFLLEKKSYVNKEEGLVGYYSVVLDSHSSR